MDGIICIQKPRGYTSFDVVAVVRGLIRQHEIKKADKIDKKSKKFKIGHGGTLDPIAEGVLPVFLGCATKAVDYAPSDNKEYIAGFKLGLTTDTQDITGTVIKKNAGIVLLNNLKTASKKFKGDIHQIPPMYSAVSIDGKRLYELARKGVTVERKPRLINIYELDILKYNEETREGFIKVACSRGTYIRTLIHDIGRELGTGAVMTMLTRTKSGIFTLDLCYDLDSLREGVKEQGTDYIKQRLIPLEKFFDGYSRISLNREQSRLFANGAELDVNKLCIEKAAGETYDGIYSVYNYGGLLIALAKISSENSFLIIQRFNRENTDNSELK